MKATSLDAILAPGGLSVQFQPIMRIQDERPSAWAVEGLVRGPQGSTVESAAILFDYVRRKGQEIAVDRACVDAVVRAAAELPHALALSINVHAQTVSRDRGFPRFLESAARARALALCRIVVEIVEHAPEWTDSGLRGGLDALRGLGVRVALDDVGLGQSNYRMVLECRPDYLKLDRYFVEGCPRDYHRRAVIESVMRLADSFDALAIVEGVEDVVELETVRSLGVPLAQGYLFGPALQPSQLRACPGAPSVLPMPVEPCGALAEGA